MQNVSTVQVICAGKITSSKGKTSSNLSRIYNSTTTTNISTERCVCQRQVAKQLPFDILTQRKHERCHRARFAQAWRQCCSSLPQGITARGFWWLRGYQRRQETDLRFADPMGKVVDSGINDAGEAEKVKLLRHQTKTLAVEVE